MKIIPKHLVACTGAVALSAAGLFAAVSPSQVQKPTTGQEKFMSEIETILAMTPAQRDQANTACQKASEMAKPIRQELMITNQSLQAAIRSDDTAQIQRLTTTEGQEIGQLLAIRSSAFAKVYKTLTPDQKTRADALHQVLMQRFRQQMMHSAERATS